jgi:hypothetical protein
MLHDPLNIDDLRHIQIVDEGRIVCGERWLKRIESEAEKMSASGHKFASNYSRQRLQLENHLSFDALVLGDEVVTWAGLYNGGRFPPGVFRVMNRLYISPKFRSPTCAYRPYARLKILPFQVHRYQSRIKRLIMSREGPSARYFLRRWVKYNAPDSDWKITDRMIQVAPAEERSCFQFIAYKDYSEIEWNPRSLTPAEWKALPR